MLGCILDIASCNVSFLLMFIYIIYIQVVSSYKGKYEYIDTPSQCRFRYHCSQLASQQKASKKIADTSKHRDRLQMNVFNCWGWLTLALDTETSVANLCLNHCLDHIPYSFIDLPSDVRDFVIENKKFLSARCVYIMIILCFIFWVAEIH